jgi:hypothetical protein
MSKKTNPIAADFASSTSRGIRHHLALNGITEFEISQGKARQVGRRLARDLDRLKNIQGDAVNSNKVAGYWGFWIRKVKPITHAYDPSRSKKPSDPKAEIHDINEKIALAFAVDYLIERGKDPTVDHFRLQCKQPCDGRGCIIRLGHELLKVNSKFAEYVVYSMRYRTFGPHHFVMFLDQLTISACFADNARKP